MRTNSTFSATLCGLLYLSCVVMLYGQTVATDPVGVVGLTVPAGSDFRFTVPMVQAAQFVGTVMAVSGSTLLINQTNNLPNWAPNAWVYSQGTQSATYYALVGSGTKEGMHSSIIVSGSNSVTVDLAGDSYAGLVSGSAGDTIKILPYWTLSTLFTTLASPSLPDQTQVLTFDGVQGINTSASTVYTYYAGFGWYNGGTLANDVVVAPGESVVVRNQSASSFNLNVVGTVPMNKHYSILSTTQPNAAQDNSIGYLCPVSAFIGQIGLGLSDQDQLLVFDNTATGLNKSASQVLTYYSGFGWYDGGTDVDATFQLTPGFGYVLRKAATAAPTSLVWQNKQGYLP